jgi:hypothetical protein
MPLSASIDAFIRLLLEKRSTRKQSILNHLDTVVTDAAQLARQWVSIGVAVADCQTPILPAHFLDGYQDNVNTAFIAGLRRGQRGAAEAAAAAGLRLSQPGVARRVHELYSSLSSALGGKLEREDIDTLYMILGQILLQRSKLRDQLAELIREQEYGIQTADRTRTDAFNSEIELLQAYCGTLRGARRDPEVENLNTSPLCRVLRSLWATSNRRAQ